MSAGSRARRVTVALKGSKGRSARCTAATDAITSQHTPAQSRRAPAVGAQATTLLLAQVRTAPSAPDCKLVTARLGAARDQSHAQIIRTCIVTKCGETIRRHAVD
jgi:hypothetical protein